MALENIAVTGKAEFDWTLDRFEAVGLRKDVSVD